MNKSAKTKTSSVRERKHIRENEHICKSKQIREKWFPEVHHHCISRISPRAKDYGPSNPSQSRKASWKHSTPNS